MAQYIKITNPSGMISFAPFSEDNLKRLNTQNATRIAGNKQKIETVEMTAKEVEEHSGYDEMSALELNPTTSKLLAEKERQDLRIAELEKALENSFEESKAKKVKTKEAE